MKGEHEINFKLIDECINSIKIEIMNLFYHPEQKEYVKSLGLENINDHNKMIRHVWSNEINGLRHVIMENKSPKSGWDSK